MSFTYKPATLLIAVVGRHKGEPLVEAAKAAGARGGTISLGRTMGDNAILQMLSLADVHQDIALFLMGDEAPTVVAALCKAANENKKLGGYAIMIDVPRMMVRLAASCSTTDTPQASSSTTPAAPASSTAPAAPAADTATEATTHTTATAAEIHKTAPCEANGSASMEPGYELVTVITNSGYADDVMAAARKAGATGGSILTARGTGTAEDVKFFGITLVPEKEMLLMVVKSDMVQRIIDAVNSVPKLNEPGGGIVYTTGVKEFIVLGSNN